MISLWVLCILIKKAAPAAPTARRPILHATLANARYAITRIATPSKGIHRLAPPRHHRRRLRAELSREHLPPRPCRRPLPPAPPQPPLRPRTGDTRGRAHLAHRR